MKDHEKRELVNRLTKIAREYAHTQQLRERIAHELLSSIESDSSFAAQAAAWRSLVEWICTAPTTVDAQARQMYALDLVQGTAFEDWYDEAAGVDTGTNAPPNIDREFFRQTPEDNVAALINEWYRLHIADGGPADATQEELIAEALAEEALGGGFSYPPGRA